MAKKKWPGKVANAYKMAPCKGNWQRKRGKFRQIGAVERVIGKVAREQKRPGKVANAYKTAPCKGNWQRKRGKFRQIGAVERVIGKVAREQKRAV